MIKHNIVNVVNVEPEMLVTVNTELETGELTEDELKVVAGGELDLGSTLAFMWEHRNAFGDKVKEMAAKAGLKT